MIKATELQFHLLEDDKTPEFTCNMCGIRKAGKGMLMAEIQIDEDATYSIVVCSEECKNKFVHHPVVDDYLADQIAHMKHLHSNQ